jgi:hypothetical protein
VIVSVDLADDLFPENFPAWPRTVQKRYLEELHALYFPAQVTAQQAVIRGEITD